LVTFGNREPDVLNSIASQLSRLDRQLTPNDRTALNDAARGQPLCAIASEIASALGPDRHNDAARAANNTNEPTDEQSALARQQLLQQAAKPLSGNPGWRNLILSAKKSYEQIVDTANRDQLLEAGPGGSGARTSAADGPVV
jgi:hypothetical protein